MTDEEKRSILGKSIVPNLYYRLDDYKYVDTSKDRVLSGIRELDYNTKGFEMGCITIWTGFTNAGKTTVMTMLAKKTIEQGERIFFFNGEQTKEDFKNNLYIQSSEKKDIVKKMFRNSCVEDVFVKQEKAVLLDKLYGNKIYIYNNEASRKIENLLYAMEELRRTQKIRVFFLDNFMQIDMKSDNIFQEQTDIMEKLRTFAVNKKVHIHLVAHPRKIERFQTRLNLYDIAGSSNIVNKAYNIISILRVDTIKQDSKSLEKLQKQLLEERYNINEVDTVLEILKTKGERCGLVGLKYIKELKTYVEAAKISRVEYEKEIYNKGDGLPW
ncbi:MAG: AAA family ATPase [Clostridia bacterium]|nr:AAA family ATPase [Clostridia bacterium]